MKGTFSTLFAFSVLAALVSGCASTSQLLNPFYETPEPVALLGEKSDRALYNGSSNEGNARAALEAMGRYRGAQEKEPYYPVMQPAVVRVMWIPERLNKYGDLIPAHYYYLKVLQDRWAVQDQFDLEKQLNGPNNSAENTNIPYQLEGEPSNR